MRKNKYVASQILDKIHSGEYKNKLPTEKKLTETFNCSINTVRVALENLKISGYITSRQGSGYFISSIPERSKYNSLDLKSLQGAYVDRDVLSKTLGFELCKCNEDEAKQLGINDKELIYKFQRVRFIDNIPHLLSYTIVPYVLFPLLDETDLQTSFYEYCEKVTNLKLSYALKEISPFIPTPEVARLLEISTDKPILKVENKGFLSNGVQFEYSINYHIDEKFGMVVRV